jgi:hypothetical protein
VGEAHLEVVHAAAAGGRRLVAPRVDLHDQVGGVVERNVDEGGLRRPPEGRASDLLRHVPALADESPVEREISTRPVVFPPASNRFGARMSQSPGRTPFRQGEGDVRRRRRRPPDPAVQSPGLGRPEIRERDRIAEVVLVVL